MSPSEASHREATLLTHLVLEWHRSIGTRLAHQKMSARPESLAKYLQLVGVFAESNLSDPRIQTEVANQQISGTFEWFYGEEIPAEMLKKWALRMEIECPRSLRLDQAARRIVEINKHLLDHESEREFGGRTVVRFTGHEDLLEKARDIYHDFVSEENIGIGGANFLLACSLERYGSSPHADIGNIMEVTLISESVLGVQRAVPGDRTDDFVDHLRTKKLLIRTTVGTQ